MSESLDLVRSIRAGTRLVFGDARALAEMDLSLTGFWRSFVVMALLVPTVFVSIVADARLAATAHEAAGVSVAGRLVVGLITYFLGWIAFPVALAGLARPFGLGAVYVPWVIARNWTAFVAVVPSFVLTTAWVLGLLPDHMLGFASLFGLGFSLWCAFVVARIVGRQPVFPAIAFVLLDLLLSMLVELGLDRLLGL